MSATGTIEIELETFVARHPEAYLIDVRERTSTRPATWPGRSRCR